MVLVSVIQVLICFNFVLQLKLIITCYKCAIYVENIVAIIFINTLIMICKFIPFMQKGRDAVKPK